LSDEAYPSSKVEQVRQKLPHPDIGFLGFELVPDLIHGVGLRICLAPLMMLGGRNTK
jgi:hypothetical protein